MDISSRWLTKWSVIVFFIAALMSWMGCGRPSAAPRALFMYSRTWQVSDTESRFAFIATLLPQPLMADKPAVLEVRVKADEPSKVFQGRVWYRFAQRRGESSTVAESLVAPPQFVKEEGLEVRYDDWFEWAEIVEPRSEKGEAVFTTPAMFSQGKVYVQFRVALAPDLDPQELLDWFVYVD